MCASESDFSNISKRQSDKQHVNFSILSKATNPSNWLKLFFWKAWKEVAVCYAANTVSLLC